FPDIVLPCFTGEAAALRDSSRCLRPLETMDVRNGRDRRAHWRAESDRSSADGQHRRAAARARTARLPDEPRYQPLLRKAMLRRIGLRGLDPALFERPKRGFVLPLDRWIRRGLSTAIDQTLCSPQAVSTAGLDAGAVRRLGNLPHRQPGSLPVADLG